MLKIFGYCYDRLLSGEVIQKNRLAKEYGVAPRSIQRDIDTIRDFCENKAASGGVLAEVKYDRIAKGYRLIDNRTVTLTNAELFSVAKILLESRSLCQEEMSHIVEELMEACLPAGERRKMNELVRNELFHYVEPKHGQHLVDRVWALGTAVYQRNVVQLEYQKVNGEVTNARIKPVGIMCSEFYFYLIAYIGDSDKKHPGYPTVYRIDRIKSFRVTGETYHIPYRDRFEEGEFRKRIQFMYGGKLRKVKFQYSGSDINAVLDRLPTAEILSEEHGVYTVCAEVYGDGIEMWLRSQGDNVKEYRRHLNQHNVVYIDFSKTPENCRSFRQYIDSISEQLKSDLTEAYPEIAVDAELAVWSMRCGAIKSGVTGREPDYIRRFQHI